ncbi:MAG: MBL fold metallo-hydrolase [Bacteroidales bacterium]|nr:MBL fold metallo-hydrolase [Bacteroidales bacterium]
MKVLLTGTGTSQGIPVINCDCNVCRSTNPKDQRLRTAAMLRSENTTIAIDAGPDFRQQMLRTNIHQVNAVLITHEHHDHIGGLDDLRPFYFARQAPLDIYGSRKALKAIKKKYYYAFEENPYPGAPQFNLHELHDKPFDIGDMKIIPVIAHHGRMEVWGFRTGKFAYMTDIKSISKTEKNKLFDLEALVINALHHKKHHSHLSLPEALELISELKPQRAYITHISHGMGKYEEITKMLPDNVFCGYDGLEITI